MGLGGRRMGRRALTKGAALAVLALLAIYALLGGDLGQDEEPRADPGETPAGLSQEEFDGIASTLAAIEAGEELPFDQDGSTFQNRERLLPDREGGYYREYTVVTPGSDDRGARRLVIGADGDTWYTRDHYDSFVQIDPEQFR